MSEGKTGQIAKRLSALAGIISQVVVVVGALGGIVGLASGFIDQMLDEIVNSRIEAQLSDENTPLGKLERRTSQLQAGSILALGEWRPRVVNQTYTAESDGFLLAYSGGNGAVARFYLKTGNGNLTARTRGVQYGGAATPVKNGSRYKVDVISGDQGTIYAFWIPLEPFAIFPD